MMQLLLIAVSTSACFNPVSGPFKSPNYRYGEGPAAHAKRLPNVWQYWNALDFLAPPGTPVYAITSGYICSKNCTYGKAQAELDKYASDSLTLIGDNGDWYYYTAMRKTFVPAGAAVKKGQKLGEVGTNGGKNSHLHLAVKVANVCKLISGCSPPDTRKCA